MMEEAKELKSIKCECGQQVAEKILREVNEAQWASLKQIETGVVVQDYVAVTKLFKCSDCGIEKPINATRRLVCGHDYCEVCLKSMLDLYKSGPPLKCTCNAEIEPEVLKSIDSSLYENYLLKVNKPKPLGKRKCRSNGK
eukprot:TRINITY_DN8880_c0_g2_i1.p1 TRINITY_DN8880_c0_g2~~TRINITY_DN8880_c0_g2_i1.p1  ORF type:complete len:140 (-),score=18.63 TRINITY_DN8880_c0_g2_i1:161-580(-)